MTHFRLGTCAKLATLSLLFVAILLTHASERVNRVHVIRVPGDAKVVKAQLGADGTLHLLHDRSGLRCGWQISSALPRGNRQRAGYVHRVVGPRR